MLAFYNNFEEAFYQCPFVRSFRTNAGYATFIKYLVIKKIGHFEDERRIQHCSVIATRSLVQKKEEPGAFTIPCTVGLLHFVKALCDLGGEHKSHAPLDLQEVGFGRPKTHGDAATDG